MNHRVTRQSGAVEPEGLEGWGCTRNPPAQPAPQDLDQRFREVTDAIDQKLSTFQQSLEFMMILLLDERLGSFEARLPPVPAVRARAHGTPHFARPP